MKIAVIGQSYPFKGGISHYNALLCQELSKKHTVKLINFTKIYPFIIYPGKTQIDRSRKKITFSGIRVLNMTNPVTWLNASLIIKRFRPKIVIMHWYSPLFSPLFTTISSFVKSFASVRIVVFCHNVIPPERRPLDKFFERLFFRYVDYFIAATDYDYNFLKHNYPNHKILINPHPNYNIFDYKKFNEDSAKKRLKLKGKCILIFGYIRKYKGLENLLKAMPYVLREQKITLIIAGEFWEDKKEYITLIKKLDIKNNVLLVDGYVNNEKVEIFFKTCDVVIIPYKSYTNSGVIQLAFSFDKPIIATDVGGFKEVIKNKGIIVPKDNPRVLAQAIISFYKYKKGKEFIENIKKERYKHSWSNVVKIIEGIISK